MDAEAPNEVMTLAETAGYLHLAERTVLRMAQRGEIPAGKVASQWRFLRPLVREWLVGRMQTLPEPAIGDATHTSDELLPLTEILRPELMAFDLQPGPKEHVLRQLVAPLSKTGFARDTTQLSQGLMDRERMMTTAVGHGIAIPHPRRPIPGMFPEPAIALGLCPKGTDFQAIDDQRVHLFFLICATRIEIHLQLMAKISWLSRREAFGELRGARRPAEALEVVSRAVRGTERQGRPDAPGIQAGRRI